MDTYKQNFDALIIGGGVIGMMTARQLQTQGFKVAVFDKGNLGGEATWAAGGILSPLNPWQQNSDSQSLINEGRQKFAAFADELKQETGVDPEHHQTGMLVLAPTDEEQLAASNWAKLNNEPIEQVGHETLCKYEPKIATDYQHALYFSNVSQIRPPKLIAALKHSLLQNHTQIFENTAVKELIFNTDDVVGINTNHKKFYADKVIICSGAWTRYLTEKNNHIDIEPVRGQILLFKPSKKLISHILLKEKAYLIPRQDGHILCGSTLEHVGFENQVTQQARLDLEAIAHQLVPELKNYQVKQQWSALRPGTKRDTPYICKHPEINGLFINSGHYRYGIIMSIASARIMTDLISNSLNQSQIAAFA